jgi:hypothetical protein
MVRCHASTKRPVCETTKESGEISVLLGFGDLELWPMPRSMPLNPTYEDSDRAPNQASGKTGDGGVSSFVGFRGFEVMATCKMAALNPTYLLPTKRVTGEN